MPTHFFKTSQNLFKIISEFKFFNNFFEVSSLFPKISPKLFASFPNISTKFPKGNFVFIPGILVSLSDRFLDKFTKFPFLKYFKSSYEVFSVFFSPRFFSNFPTVSYSFKFWKEVSQIFSTVFFQSFSNLYAFLHNLSVVFQKLLPPFSKTTTQSQRTLI